MKKLLLFQIWFFLSVACYAQRSYKDSIQNYLKNYVDSHEVVKGEDRKHLHFFDVDPKYRVVAKFEKVETAQWFEMPTSGKIKKVFRQYGVLSFTINLSLIHISEP